MIRLLINWKPNAQHLPAVLTNLLIRDVIFHIKRLINLLYMMDRGKNPGLSSRKETYRFASFVEHAIREGENSCRKRGGGRPRRRYLTK